MILGIQYTYLHSFYFQLKCNIICLDLHYNKSLKYENSQWNEWLPYVKEIVFNRPNSYNPSICYIRRIKSITRIFCGLYTYIVLRVYPYILHTPCYVLLIKQRRVKFWSYFFFLFSYFFPSAHKPNSPTDNEIYFGFQYPMTLTVIQCHSVLKLCAIYVINLPVD